MAWQKMVKQKINKPTNPNMDWKWIQKEMLKLGEKVTKGQAKKIFRESMKGEKWLNNLYSVTVKKVKLGKDDILEFSIARRDQSHIHDWRHLQQIKNDIAGNEAEGIELFPAESRLLDQANTFWLYVIPAKLVKQNGYLPFGYTDARSVNTVGNLDSSKGSIQRPYSHESNWS